jgi:hypothetical protein
MEHFRLDSFEDSLPELVHLFNKFWPQFRVRNILQTLQILFCFNRSDHCETVPIFKKVHDQSPYPILFLNCIRDAFLFLQSFLQIVFLVDLISILIQQFQTEVSHYPHEWRKVLSHFVRIRLILLRLLNLQLLGQIHNEWKILQSILINCAHAIVDKIWTEQKSQKKDPGVVVLVFIECPYSFAVYHKYFQGLLSWSLEFERLAPNLETLQDYDKDR